MANSSTSRGRSRRRKSVGSAVRVIAAEPRRKVRATHKTYFKLYFPRLTWNPWRTAEEWRASRPKFLACALYIVLLIGLYQIYNLPAFFVDRVEFSGNRIISAEELGQAASIHNWSIFFVDPRELENSLRKIPDVKEAHVTVSLPNIVRAEVAERLPRLVWETQGQTFWVDENGISLRARANIPGILWLKDLDNAPVKVGERINTDAFNALVSLRNLWPDGPTTFEWSRHKGLSARESHGWLVYFGRSSQMEDKMVALQVVTAQILKESKAINFIDLSSGLAYYQETTRVASTNPNP